MKPAFRPVAKKAPPRPRRLEAFSSSMTAEGSRPRARSSCAYPPTARNSSIRERSWSSAPASTIGRSSGIATQLLDDRADVRSLDALPVAVVDGDDRRPAAAAEALDRAQRHRPVLRRLARAHAELRLERLQHALRALEAAADVRADLDHVPPDGLQVVHVVEGRDRLAVRRGQAQGVPDLVEGLRRQPPRVALLREPERGHDRRPRVGVLRRDLAHLLGERAHRSTSPMTVSREPTIAIMSAIRASDMHVAVASRATNEGARNLTRHGFGPPSETT